MPCTTCGRENPPDSRFCNSCGATLEAPPPRREERKVVTVLFADLVGFTSRAEQLDPEDVRALLAPYWEHLRDEPEHYGATVEKFIGDVVVALDTMSAAPSRGGQTRSSCSSARCSAFFRGVGATRGVRDAEALLAATA